MAEDPVFSGFSNDGAASTFASTIAKIKADMAAIERSAKSIENSLSRASKSNLGGGGGAAGATGGTTGTSKAAFGDSSLGKITSQLGGWSGIGHTAAFGAGAAMGGMGIGGSSQGAIAGGIAFSALPDLVLRPERALDMENARFGVAQTTGDFGTFQRMMDGARNSFNVQDRAQFQNTLVYGTQRAGMIGLMGGGTQGEQRAAAQIGGYNTMAGLAGVDQSQVIGAMGSMQSSQAYYASMAAGIQTRNPVTGQPIGIEGVTNQMFDTSGFGRMGQKKALDQIDIAFGAGGMGRQQLVEQGYDEAAINMVVEGLRIRAKTGEPLKENQVQEQMKALGENGGLGTENTQGNEGTRALENAKAGLDLETLNAATAGIEEATKHLTNAVEYLTDLEGSLKTLRDGYVTLANQMDVFKTEAPGMTKGLTDFFTGLPGLLMSFLLGKGMGGGAGGSLLGRLGGSLLARVGGSLGLSALGTAAAPVIGVGAALAAPVILAGTAGKWAVNKYTDYDEHKGKKANEAIARDAGTAPRTASGYGGYAKGDWFVESDQDARIHYGEMVLPNRVATAVREELSVGKTDGQRATPKSKDGVTVNIYLTVQKASDQEAMQFAGRVKKIIESDRELLAIGSGGFARG